MNKPCRLLTAVALAGFLPRAFPAQAQLLKPTSAPEQNWVSLAASADGTRLAAVGSYGWLYLSSDAGSNWVSAVTAPGGPEPERPWTAVASSADGTQVVAVANFVPIFCSTNGGLNWTKTGPSTLWSCVAASADGKVLLAGDYNDGFLYLSGDHGIRWVPSSAPPRRWRSVAASGDGTKLFATADYGTNYSQVPGIYVSTNSGATWALADTPAGPWQAVVSSADGKKVAVGGYAGPVLVSIDAGAHWIPTTLPNSQWGGLAMSADATRLIAASAEGIIYISNDSGGTWMKANAPNQAWQAVVCSSDGLRLFAGAWSDPNGGIYSAQLLPKLDITSSSSGLVISWPDSVQGFALEQSTDIWARNWRPVSTLPTTMNGQNQITIKAPSGTSAFRLVRRQ
jgi:photosystem II stability/assembly factor-like uncharacterized protein